MSHGFCESYDELKNQACPPVLTNYQGTKCYSMHSFLLTNGQGT